MSNNKTPGHIIVNDPIIRWSFFLMIFFGLSSFVPHSLYLGAFFLLIMMIACAVCQFRFAQLMWRD